MSFSSGAVEPSKSSIDDGVFVIDAAIVPQWFEFQELWRYRELVWILALRDIQVRYRQAVVGLAWVVLQPVTQTFVFHLFFRLVRPSGREIQSATSMVTIFCGLALWQFFASILIGSTNCLVDNRQLLTKVYFPRVVLPLSAAFRPLIDFVIVFFVLLVFMACWGIWPGVSILVVPLIVLATMIVGLSFGLWLSALNAHYRDFGHIVPFALQIGLFASPVIVETSALIPPEWRLAYAINPMASLLDTFRACVIGTEWPTLSQLVISFLAESFLLSSGAWYFRRVERFLADRI